MFGVIKKLIGGIFSFIAGLLPGKKTSGGYYLQLDESGAEVKPAPTVISNGAEASEPAKKPAPTALEAKVEVSKPPVQAATVVATKEPTETNFATKYLMPTASNVRRRPGANMSSFLDMASQVKTTTQG